MQDWSAAWVRAARHPAHNLRQPLARRHLPVLLRSTLQKLLQRLPCTRGECSAPPDARHKERRLQPGRRSTWTWRGYKADPIACRYHSVPHMLPHFFGAALSPRQELQDLGALPRARGCYPRHLRRRESARFLCFSRRGQETFYSIGSARSGRRGLVWYGSAHLRQEPLLQDLERSREHSIGCPATAPEES